MRKEYSEAGMNAAHQKTTVLRHVHLLQLIHDDFRNRQRGS